MSKWESVVALNLIFIILKHKDVEKFPPSVCQSGSLFGSNYVLLLNSELQSDQLHEDSIEELIAEIVTSNEMK